MQLVNHTRYPAEIFRTVIDQERFAAAVFTRVTYDVVDGALVPAAEQRWKVSGPPWECEHGPMDSDEVFYRGGVDLFLFGHARAPGGQPVSWMDVRVQAGAWSRVVRVFGDRVWLRRGGALAPSEPQQFRAVPLSLQRAYGGRSEWDELPLEYPANPSGVGYYLTEEEAEGRPLPNLEEPHAPLRAWNDQGDPVAFGACLPHFGQRLMNGVRLDDRGNLVELRPTFFNAAFPPNILSTLAPGDTVWVEGVREEGPFAFRVPDGAPRVRLRFDDEVIDRPLVIDQIGLEPDRSQVFLAYRYPFRYVFHAMQRRSCELFAHPSEGGTAP